MIYFLVAILAALVCSAMSFKFYTHIFQLNSYNSRVQLRWLLKNFANRPLIQLVFVAVPFIFINSQLFMIMAAFFMLISIFIYRQKNVKKKFVFTKRMVRLAVAFGVVMIAIAGALVIFVENSYASVAAMLVCVYLVPLIVLLCNLITRPLELMINQHFINDAKRIIADAKNLTVIGITGSYGKTSTKYFVKTLLESEFQVLMTPESYNTTLGVVKTVRGELKATHEIFVCEMGARIVGEIAEICDIVKPSIGVITSIGYQHLESFGSIENIIKTKFEMVDCLPKDGVAILNYDNDFIRNHPVGNPVVSYGIEQGVDKDYQARDISFTKDGTRFTVVAKSGEEAVFETKIIGLHNVLNITAAIAIANRLGVSFNKLISHVKRLEAVPHRLQLRQNNNMAIIDDAYNSNLVGAKSALDCLNTFEGMKILITPGMVELGAKQDEMNFDFGAYAATICDMIILIGRIQTLPIANGVNSMQFTAEKLIICDTFLEGFAVAEKQAQSGAQVAVLIENDLPDNY